MQIFLFLGLSVWALSSKRIRKGFLKYLHVLLVSFCPLALHVFWHLIDKWNSYDSSHTCILYHKTFMWYWLFYVFLFLIWLGETYKFFSLNLVHFFLWHEGWIDWTSYSWQPIFLYLNFKFIVHLQQSKHNI